MIIILTDKDINRLTAVLASKHEVRILTEKVDRVENSINKLTVAVDGLTQAIDNLRVEYAAITSQLNRHELWIKQIAEKAKVKLEF